MHKIEKIKDFGKVTSFEMTRIEINGYKFRSGKGQKVNLT